MNSGCCRGRPPFPLNADFFFFSFSSPLSGASWFSHTPNPVWVSYHGKNPRHLQTSRSFAGGPSYCHVRTRGHIPSPFPVAACHLSSRAHCSPPRAADHSWPQLHPFGHPLLVNHVIINFLFSFCNCQLCSLQIYLASNEWTPSQIHFHLHLQTHQPSWA